ncbi:hypothetical protein [Clostridium tyrobutyricum]|uniref:hypothetical protein n=1 Tax=Clostridium tyrobutyricum TaxID=1519 RepID=UPI0020131C6F|nr:hypothetical protein [Clostridium tyrobutyricum]MBR9648741.1 hypothetical protein [Clostridium tyrobutyricum]
MKRLLGIILTGILLIGVTACGDSEEKEQALIAPTQQAVDLTVKTLKQNELVRDAGVGVHKDKSTIKIAIQTKVPLNEQNAKSLIDSGIRQLSGFNDGEGGQPTKDYYGKLWDTWNAEVVIFVNESELTLRGDKIPGKDAPITYTNKGNPAD